MIAFVLINVEPNNEHIVYNRLLEISEIEEIHPLFGEYDLIVKINTDSWDNIGHIVLHKIRGIEGVIDTRTLTGIKI